MSDKVQEIKMQELRDLFFYVFGIVPLQNYGVVGDGITDNRLKIQQAIYDAIEIGAKYIYVPAGEFYYDSNLFQTDKVIFIGNNTRAKIDKIEILQFPDLWNDSQAETSAIVPVAGIIIYAGKNEIPQNFLECNGQTVVTKDYLSLYGRLNNIDISEDTQDIPETFNIPNLTTNQEGIKYIIRVR